MPEVVAEAMLTAMLPPTDVANTPLLLRPVVESAPQLTVTDPVPAACAETAVALSPVVVTLGQPPMSIAPVGLNALAMMPPPLTVLTVPVRTVTLPVKPCAAMP